jgi:hypothetical protein
LTASAIADSYLPAQQNSFHKSFFKGATMRMPLTTLTLLIALASPIALAADTPPKDATSAPAYTLAAMQPAKLKATTIVFQTIHTALNAQGDLIRQSINDLYAKLKTAHIAPIGGPIMIFKSLPQDPSVAVDIDIAIPVPDDTAAPEGTQMRPLPSVPSMTAIYQGSTTALNRGYTDFFEQLQGFGKIPAGELRQRTLYFESENSPNNVILIELPTRN